MPLDVLPSLSLRSEAFPARLTVGRVQAEPRRRVRSRRRRAGRRRAGRSRCGRPGRPARRTRVAVAGIDHVACHPVVPVRPCHGTDRHIHLAKILPNCEEAGRSCPPISGMSVPSELVPPPPGHALDKGRYSCQLRKPVTPLRSPASPPLPGRISSWRARAPFAMVTVAVVDGSAPLGPGACPAVGPKGEVIGGISRGCVEGRLYELAEEALRTGDPGDGRERAVTSAVTKQPSWPWPRFRGDSERERTSATSLSRELTDAQPTKTLSHNCIGYGALREGRNLVAVSERSLFPPGRVVMPHSLRGVR
ncbi:XdhC family protein [Streptomyces sp. R41]|uniref:XdhC family protein n=1 Tax=Streptomyces sp. R41 TaxID=3238632 RepID=A0AB39R4I0_9ACTN